MNDVPLPWPEAGRVFVRESDASATARYVLTAVGDRVEYATVGAPPVPGGRSVRFQDGGRYRVSVCSLERWVRWASGTRKLLKHEAMRRGLVPEDES